MRNYRVLIIALCIALCLPVFAFASGDYVGEYHIYTSGNGGSYSVTDNTVINNGAQLSIHLDMISSGWHSFVFPNRKSFPQSKNFIIQFAGTQFDYYGLSSNNLDDFKDISLQDMTFHGGVTTCQISLGSSANDYYYLYVNVPDDYELNHVSNSSNNYIGYSLVYNNYTYPINVSHFSGFSDNPFSDDEPLLNTTVGDASGASTSVIAVLPGFGCVIENGSNTQFELEFDGSTKKYNGGSFYSGQRVWASNSWLTDFQLNRFAETEENIKWNSDGSLLHRSSSGSALISVPSGKYTYFVNPAQYIEYGQAVYNNGNMFIRPIGGNAKSVKTFRLGNPSNTDNAEDNAFEITLHDDTQFYEIGSYNGQDSQYYPSVNAEGTKYTSDYQGTPEGYNQYELPSGGGISADEIGSFNDNTSAINQFLSDATQNASSIQQNASGFFETMRNMFSWLPDEIISLLIAFISIVLIVGLFKVFL